MGLATLRDAKWSRTWGLGHSREGVQLALLEFATYRCVADFLFDLERTNPQSLELGVFALVLMGPILFKNQITHTKFIVSYRILVKPPFNSALVDNKFLLGL